MEHFDLVIIGSGSGNSLVTEDFAGKRVAVVEAGTFGGTCLNVGCIPTKMFVYPAEVARLAAEVNRLGVEARVDGVRWREIRDRVFGRIDPISEGGRLYRAEGEGTTLFEGWARFVGPREVEVTLNDGGTTRITGEHIVIATGAHAHVPDVVASAGVDFHTSDTIMRIPELPERLVIIGGGYIATEFAHVFSSFGVEVTVVARGDALLRHLDPEVSRRFTEVARTQWDVRLGAQVRAVSDAGGGHVDVVLDDGATVRDALLLVCTGRVPNTADLGLEAAGIDRDEAGRVVVDPHGRTQVPGVWSLGDASSHHQLKHVANHEARVVAHNMAHPDDLRSFEEDVVPAAVFTHPQIATVGATQTELEEAGTPFRVKVQDYADVAFGWAMEENQGAFCKVLASPEGTILGVHVMGHEAALVVQPAVTAMVAGWTAHETARRQMWIHPALSEVLENALLGV